jgi:hypothetical protein
MTGSTGGGVAATGRGGAGRGGAMGVGGGGIGFSAFGGLLPASSSAMIRRMEARISSIDGSCALAG